jgi:RimJ/RimL family protein N-acetyltransferase
MSIDPLHPDNAAAGPVAPPAREGAAAGRFAPWIPIRSLSARHRERILAHLKALSEADRYLRFGYAAGDEQIARYVAGLDFERDEVFGVYNRKLELIALAHLAYPAADSPVPGAAEFGGSVVAQARGRGYGARLFEHAMLHARNRGLDTLFIHALSENTAMLRIARKAGARVERAGSETDAFLKLPHDTLASKVEQWVGDGAAELDYRLKQQAHMMDTLIDAIGDVRAQIGKSNGSAAKD